MLKQDILEYIKNQTSFFEPRDVNDVFQATNIAENFQVKRNTASHYLNQLTEEGELVKVNTRPVYFFHKQIFEQQNYPLKKNLYQSLDEIIDERPIFDKKQDFFKTVIGSNGSLAHTIEQLKMAALYPDGGLPVLMTGESGVGKSFLAKIFYNFCLTSDILADDGPMITVNCAQYANNPELLTSNLFGHVKGAFTGADTDRKGAFELADGGLLFLDEVHRLSPEGQEKLFTFLDQGIIFKMGDSEHPIHVNCRLVFATTEDINSTFLTTFLRRIPVQISIPRLEQRTQSERKQLIIQGFFFEQQKFQKSILVSPQVLNILENRIYQGNVGELRNLIKIITAKAYSDNPDLEKIEVTLNSLPTSILSEQAELVLTEEKQYLILDGQYSLDYLIEESELEQKRIIQSYEKIVSAFVDNHYKINDAVNIISKEIDYLFDYLLFEVKKNQNHEMLLFITQHVRQMLEKVETSFQISFNGSIVYAISNYLFQRRGVDWIPEKDMNYLIEQLRLSIQTKFPNSYRYAEQILSLIKGSLDIKLSVMDRIILAVYINGQGYTKNSSYPRAIIVTHGYATASSISNVANRMLNESIFQSFDMPLDVTPKKIAENIVRYSERNDVSNGLIILFDMGSLKEIYQYFPKNMTGPIILMNNVTTSLAIAVGEAIKSSMNLSEIPKFVEKNIKNEWKLISPPKGRKKVILTTCATGIGTAVQISNLLEKSLPNGIEMGIMPCDFHQLLDSEAFKKSLSLYDIVGIVGTTNPFVENISFVSLEDLISGKGLDTLMNWLKDEMSSAMLSDFNNQMVRNFSLDRVIQSVTILDTEKVMEQIELFLIKLEERFDESVQNDKKIALFVHVSCLIERLIRNEPIESYSGQLIDSKCLENRVKSIKEAFSVIEKVYSVEIPNAELFYVYDILFGKTEYISNDSEF